MMNEREPDPYAPPRSEVEVNPLLLDVARRRRVDVWLRWAGASSMGWLVVVGLMRWDSGTVGLKMMVTVLWCGIAAGFLHGGRWWQLGIAVLMLLSLVMLAGGLKVTMESAERMGTPLDADFWWTVPAPMVSNAITAVCGVALFVRRRGEGKV